jgi:hypothetical protein
MWSKICPDGYFVTKFNSGDYFDYGELEDEDPTKFSLWQGELLSPHNTLAWSMDANVSLAAYEARLRKEQSYQKKDKADEHVGSEIDDDVGNEVAWLVRTRSLQ